MQAAQAAARARYAQAASAFAPLTADNLAPQMQLFIERCETLYGASPPVAAPPPHAYTGTLTPRASQSCLVLTLTTPALYSNYTCLVL